MSAKNSEERQQRLAAGLCGACGKCPPKPGLKTCQGCIDYQKWYSERNYERVSARLRRWRLSRRLKVLEHYGGKCECCGEDNPAFLTIDHIDGHGNDHRRAIFGRHEGHGPFTEWLCRNNFPPGFQVLCWNCNAAKAYNPGGCPHQQVNNVNT